MQSQKTLLIVGGCVALLAAGSTALWQRPSQSPTKADVDAKRVADYVAARANLAIARKKWASKKAQNYDYTFEQYCFCPPELMRPVAFSVEGGKPVDVPALPSLAARNTIDKLLAFLQTALDARPDRFVAEYDSEFGFPVHVTIDPSSQIADDEYSFMIDNFESR